MNDNANEENSRWNLHRWYSYKHQLNTKVKGTHKLKNSRKVLFCGTDYSGGRVDQHSIYKLTYPNRFVHGKDSYKDVKAVKGSTSELRCNSGDGRVEGPVYKYFLDVIVFDLFDRHPVMDTNKKSPTFGQQKTYTRGSREGELMWEYRLVLDKTRKKEIMADLDNLVANEEVVTSRKMFISVGSGHFQSIEKALLPSRHMSTCGGTLATVEYVCESCGTTVDSLDETDLEEQEDFDALVLEDIRCTDCGHVGRPVPIKECLDSDDPNDFTEMGPSRVIVELKMVGSGKDSKFVARNTTRLEDFTDVQGNPIIELDENGDAVLLDDSPIFVEGLDAAVAAHWDFEGSITYPDYEIARDLGLKKGDVGYAEYVAAPSSNSKRKPSRRRTF